MKLFGGGGPDHPFADPREARRLLEALPANDPVKALEEIAHWFESVAAAEGFKPEARIALLLQLDDAAQPQVRKLVREYFGPVRLSRFQENRLWTSLHGYWKQAGYAFARAVDLFLQGAKGAEAARAQLPLLLVRTLRSLAQHIKWMSLRYGPFEPLSWGVLNSVFAFAESRQLTQAQVTVYPGVAGDSTPQQEFLRAVMFSASGPDGLLPAEVELAERLIYSLSSHFVLTGAPTPECPFWTELGQPMPPARAARLPHPGPGLRCFGAGRALTEVHELAEKLMVGGPLPPALNGGISCEPHTALDVLRHLELCWSPQPPERKSQRHAVKSRLSVSHGFDSVLEALGGGGSLDFEHERSESWTVENVSAGGFGAVVPQVKGDWLRVGALLALQPEGGTNWVLGVVRRVNRTAGQQARVGIETLSRTPVLTNFAVAGVQSVREHGVVLRSGAEQSLIVLKPGVFAPAQNLEAAAGSRQVVFIPQAIAERGEDYEIARFRAMVRET